jgi:4-hydroxy-tetrahydrodipicolinate synthase
MSNSKFCGTGVAVVTPFHENGEVDYDSFKKIIHYINAQADFLVVLGTTGENPVLSAGEKLKVIQSAVEFNEGKVPLVAGVGGYDTVSVTESLKKYSVKGVDAILSVTPYYNKPQQQGLYEHYRKVSEHSTFPVIMYNVPGRTGVNMLPETTLRIASDFPNMIAVKEASGNMEQIMAIIKDKPDKFLVISGDDALTLPLVAAGADGVISVTANALPGKVTAMVRAAREDKWKEARSIHYEIIDFTSLLFREGSPAGIKAALSSLNLCKNILRLPLVTVSDKHYQLIAEKTRELTA